MLRHERAAGAEGPAAYADEIVEDDNCVCHGCCRTHTVRCPPCKCHMCFSLIATLKCPAPRSRVNNDTAPIASHCTHGHEPRRCLAHLMTTRRVG